MVSIYLETANTSRSVVLRGNPSDLNAWRGLSPDPTGRELTSGAGERYHSVVDVDDLRSFASSSFRHASHAVSSVPGLFD